MFVQRKERKPIGLKDGGHVILKCSGCGKPLANVWITRPDEKDPSTGKLIEWQIKANCCYCGDKSFVKKIFGGFHLGGFALPHPTDPTDDIPHTVVIDTKVDNNGIINVETKRAEK